MPDWTLAVDFGTTFTVGAVAEDGRVTLVDVEGNGNTRIPSAVWLDDNDELTVGNAALHQAVFAPDRFEATPKRHVGEEDILLGDQLISMVDVVAALLGRVAQEAIRHHGGEPPTELRLTHPAAWAGPKTEVLTAAASAAELPEPRLVSEPVAAALRLGAGVAVGQHVAVYDFGGGTFDAAVVTRTPSGYEQAGKPGGRDPLGGEDIDNQIVGYLTGLPIGELPEWELLLEPPDEKWRRHAAAFRAEIQRVKEGLSTALDRKLWVPGIDREQLLTRPELDALIETDVDSTVEILRETIDASGCNPDQLAGIYLVGGSSRIPLVADKIWRAFGRQPDVRDDPKAVVAKGAADWQVSPPTRIPPRPGPPPTTPPARTPPPAGPDAPGGRVRSRLAMRTVLPLWAEQTDTSATLTLRRNGLVVRVADAPAGHSTTENIAQGAGFRWAQRSGYTEISLGPSKVLEREGGLERTLLADVGGDGVRWIERYLVSDGRAVVVTAHDAAREVADSLRRARPTLDSAKHFEPCFAADVPEGWSAGERLELVRTSSSHRIIAEGNELAGAEGTSWAREEAEQRADLLESRALRIEGPAKAKVLGQPDGVTFTVVGSDETLTRLWMWAGGGRRYVLSATLPRAERFGFRLLAAHVVLTGVP